MVDYVSVLKAAHSEGMMMHNEYPTVSIGEFTKIVLEDMLARSRLSEVRCERTL